jgi:hypothetical protein
LRTASKDAFMCLPRIPPEGFRRDQVFPDGRTIERAAALTIFRRRRALVSSRWRTGVCGP